MSRNTKKEDQDAAWNKYDATKWIFFHSVRVR